MTAVPDVEPVNHRSVPEAYFVDSTDGVSVAVYDFGGDGPLLMMCHATGFCGPMWAPIARALSDRFHCVALDFRGHGRTGRPDGVSLQWQGMGHDLLAVIDDVRRRHLSSGPVFAIGHSMGGASIVLAELARPGTIARAWALEPILFPTPADIEPNNDGVSPVHESPLVAGARRRRPEFESRDAAFERYGSRPPFSEIDAEVLRLYVDEGFRDLPDGTVRLRCEPESEAQIFENSLCGAFYHLGEIGFPFLVAASGDGQAPAMVAETVVAQNSNFELAEYPDLTHFGPFEDPKRIAADAAEWFSQTSV